MNRHLQLDVVGTSAPGRSVHGLSGVGLVGLEPLYQPAEVAAYLHLDASSVRRLFADEPGVVKIGRPAARGAKRSYCTLRIPRSVLERFIRDRTGRTGPREVRRRTVAQFGGREGTNAA